MEEKNELLQQNKILLEEKVILLTRKLLSVNEERYRQIEA